MFNLLIACPKCAKIYHVEPSELPPPQKADRKGRGWFLSCQYCFHEWWFKSPQGFSWYEGGESLSSFGKTVIPKRNRFFDQTNIDTLKNSKKSESDQQIVHDRLMKEGYSPFFNKNNEETASVLSIQKEKIGTSYWYKAVVFFLFSICLMTLLYIFNIIKIEDLSLSLNSNTVPKNQVFNLKMQVSNVHYATEEKGEEKVVSIFWDIINDLESTESVPPVTISIYGICPASSTTNQSLQSLDSYCLLKTWQHQDNSVKIDPKSNAHFESKGNIPRDATPLKIQIEINPF